MSGKRHKKGLWLDPRAKLFLILMCVLSSMFINRLSAKGTDGVMKPERVLSPLKIVCYTVHGGVRQTTQTVEVSGGAV